MTGHPTSPLGGPPGPSNPPSPSGRAGRHRVALYSHDTQGLGHTRRNILVASALVAARPETDVLILTGAPEATMLPMPPSTEVLTLPTLRKHLDGRYSPRVLSAPLGEVLQMRSHLVETALAAFEPDLFVVDKVARGVQGELDLALATLRRTGRTRTVLGLRDVLDTPTAASSEWLAARTSDTVRAHYDEIWVYGDPSVYDPVAEYALPGPVARKVTYTGYLAGPRPDCLRVPHARDDTAPPDEPFVLCMVGGGEDGAGLARAFLRAPLPADHGGVVLTGPYMPAGQRADLLREASRRDDMVVHEFVSCTHDFVQQARAAVSMGGYNSVCELLAADRPTLVVPRVVPRAEQALRAQRLARAGWVDVLTPDEVTPQALGGWLSRATSAPRRVRRAIDLDGLTRIPRLAEQLYAAQRTAEEVPDVAV